MPPKKKHRLLKVLGPGLITGAADDDPSGVSTYSTAGAAFGYALLWTAPFALPLMIAVQLMCARIGMVAGRGLAGVLRASYPRWALWLCCALLLVANTVNIGADLAAMAAVLELLTGLTARAGGPLFGLIILALLVFETYPVIARVFKWLTLVLFAYVLTAFFAHANWTEVLRSSVFPEMHTDRR
jgi:NRAMP (natural resistance-associated macrophage protein)-like metal ion transporter